MHIRQVTTDEIQASSSQSASGRSTKAVNLGASKSAEIWILVTAGTTPNFDFDLDTSIDGVNDGSSTEWASQGTISVTSASGAAFIIAISRTDDALGNRLRVRWTRNAGSLTFSIKAVNHE